jgi:hypothetical protein
MRTLDQAMRRGKFILVLTLPVVLFLAVAIRPYNRWWRGRAALGHCRRAQGRLRAGAKDAWFVDGFGSTFTLEELVDTQDLEGDVLDTLDQIRPPALNVETHFFQRHEAVIATESRHIDLLLDLVAACHEVRVDILDMPFDVVTASSELLRESRFHQAQVVEHLAVTVVSVLHYCGGRTSTPWAVAAWIQSA